MASYAVMSGQLASNESPEPSETNDAREPEREVVLSFRNVVKEYFTEGGAVRALNQVSLDVSSGAFLALVGRSGCGKSTLLNLAGAMDFPTSGRVLLDGTALEAMDDASLTRLRRERVGFVFQSFQLLQTLSVVENIELPLLLARSPSARARALEKLDEVSLSGYAQRLPHQLSGGQMQRVAIARALVHKPKLLLADEPTGNLDTASGDAILQLLKHLRDEARTTILMATHSVEAAAYADAVVHMRDGRIETVIQN